MKFTNLSDLLLANPSLGDQICLQRRSRLEGTISKRGNEYLVLESGAAVIYARNPTDVPFFLSVVGCGHVFTPAFGYAGQVGGLEIGVEALVDCTLRSFPYGKWKSLASQFDALDKSIIEQSAEQLQIIQFHLAQHCLGSSVERTRFALYSYAKCLGRPSPCGRVAIRVSRAELASWISVSIDRISRIVRQLHNADELTIEGRSILIKRDMIEHIQAKSSWVA